VDDGAEENAPNHAPAVTVESVPNLKNGAENHRNIESAQKNRTVLADRNRLFAIAVTRLPARRLTHTNTGIMIKSARGACRTSKKLFAMKPMTAAYSTPVMANFHFMLVTSSADYTTSGNKSKSRWSKLPQNDEMGDVTGGWGTDTLEGRLGCLSHRRHLFFWKNCEKMEKSTGI
jgi:hypothetical protein